MTVGDYLLIPLILFTILLYPLLRKAVSLAEIFVSKYIRNASEPAVSRQPEINPAFLNLKLLAYERIVLFIERMKPDSLIPRTLVPALKAREYHQLLLNEIRKEYEYNLSQQLYVSTNAWTAASNLKNNIVTLINSAASECEAGQPASELAQKILERYIHSDLKTDQVLQIIKKDIQTH